jgi:ABC-2 type transport system ATP-binding protein
VLILDEPANGLDPQGMRWLRDLLRDQAAGSRAVLVSSHVLSEVDQTADELVMIRDGKLVAQTSLAEFTAGAGRIRVRASRPAELRAALEREGAGVRENEEGALEVSGVEREPLGDLALRLGIAIYELAPERSSLEERFIELMDEDREEAA